MAVINFEIFKVIGTLSEDKDGWKKQLTCTSWGKYNPKFDLRAWDSEYTSMKKGITLSLEELIALRDLLNESDLETILAEAIEEKQASQNWLCKRRPSCRRLLQMPSVLHWSTTCGSSSWSYRTI